MAALTRRWACWRPGSPCRPFTRGTRPVAAGHLEQRCGGRDLGVEVTAQRTRGLGEAVLEVDHQHRRALAQTDAAADSTACIDNSGVVQIPVVGHVITPSPFTEYGIKGGGEGGRMGAPSAISCAVEDALRPLGVKIDALPITPIALRAKIRASNHDFDAALSFCPRLLEHRIRFPDARSGAKKYFQAATP